MLEITYTFCGKTCYMYFKGTEDKAKAHFTKQIRECGFKGAKLVSVKPMTSESYEIPRLIISPQPLKPKRKPRKRSTTTGAKTTKRTNERAEHSATDTSKPKTNRKATTTGGTGKPSAKTTKPRSVRSRSNPRNSPKQ